MFRKLGLALVAAAFALGTAAAHAQTPRDRTTLTVVGAGVGAGTSAIYWSLNGWKWKWDSARAGISQAGAWGLTTMGCAALSPIVATAVLNRPLSYREAHILIGGCVVPIIGGWLIDQAYENHILWAPDEPQPAAVRVSRKRAAHHRS